MQTTPAFNANSRPSLALILSAIAIVTLSGCSVLAAPCRISAAVVKTVPVVGKVAAVPLDVCADIID
ncbi:MAG: hypothetical protein EBT08_06770 [Betaproteobacteria bacterium]|nr:hypothetical protein [Betaproteobacteria bacterium]